MVLQEYRETFYTFSGKASDLNRQLAFAGIATIWLFKRDVSGTPTLPHELYLPTFLLILSLAFDMLHYCVAASIWRWVYRSKEKAGVGEKVNVHHSETLELPIYGLFVLKIVCLFVAYFSVGMFIFKLYST